MESRGHEVGLPKVTLSVLCPLEVRRDDSARIRENVRHEHNSPLCKYLVRRWNRRTVRGFDDQLCLQSLCHVLSDHATERGGNEKFAFDPEDVVATDAIGRGESCHPTGSRHVIRQRLGVNPRRIVHSAGHIGYPDHSHAE